MAAIFLFLLVSVCFTLTIQQKTSNISLGSSLSPTTSPTSWLSPSGQFTFGFYPQGNGFAIGIWFARIPGKTVVWTANRNYPPVSSNVTLLLTNDGRLILRSAQADCEDKSIFNLPGSASSASMLDSGNFVLYNSYSEIIWQSFGSPTDTILQGQRLIAGKELVSSVSETNRSTGRFRLKMQHDGNLVQYPVRTPDDKPYAYWGTGLSDAGDNVTLNFDDNGHMYLLNRLGSNIKNVNDGGFPSNGTIFYRLTIDLDGIFRLYSNSLDGNDNWSMKWSSSNNKCDPKGLCGLNQYCILMDQEPNCRCLPGFDFVDPGQPLRGCERNFSVEGCRNKKEEDITDTMYALENTVCEDNAYSILSFMTQENCEQSCCIGYLNLRFCISSVNLAYTKGKHYVKF